MSWLKLAADSIFDIFFPRHCPICDDVTLDGKPICDTCREELEKARILPPVCRKCGMPKDECTCKTTVYLFDGLAVPFRYADAGKQLALNIKAKRSYENAAFAAGEVADCVTERFSDISFDLVTAVPMTDKKRRKTEFDHAALLARDVAGELDLPYVITLIQIRSGKPQHELPLEDRRRNVRNLYGIAPKCSLEGKTVLLIDDIKTSGATLNECAHLLRLSGAKAVYVAAVAEVCKKTL